VTEYSINLWELDLAKFEIVTVEEEQAAWRSKFESPSSSTFFPVLN
jgi:hypothetical protein